MKIIINNLEKRGTRNLDETFGVQKSVFEKYIISKIYLIDSVRKYSLLHKALLILTTYKKNFFYNYDLISKL